LWPVYSASLIAADEAHKERMKKALGARTAAVSLAERPSTSDSGTEPAFNAALVAADFAHFEALRSSEARRLRDREIARATYRATNEVL
jgi:hypothetical protein